MSTEPSAPTFDLLLKGGRVIDPRNGIDAAMDVAISGSKIAAVSSDIPAASARRTVDVSGMVVTPGLIDLHAHFFGYFGAVYPDTHCLPYGTTTAVDAGGAGHFTFDEFNESVIQTSRVRVFALLNIAGLGMTGQPEQDLTGMSAELATAKIKQRPDVIVGLKVAHYSGPGWQPLDRAVQAARETGTFVMVDQTPIASRTMDDMMLKHLGPGDVVTHCYAFSKPMTNPDWSLKDYFRQARERGVQFDIGHGAGSFSFKIAQAAIDAGFTPDTVSTDLHKHSFLANQATMTETMTKLLACGMELPDIVAKSTWAPAQQIRQPEIGHISVAAEADIAVLRVEEGELGLTDNGNTGHRVRRATRRITCQLTLKGGAVVWDANGRAHDDWRETPPADGTLP